MPISRALGFVLEMGLASHDSWAASATASRMLGPFVRRVGYWLTLGYVWVGILTVLILFSVLRGGLTAGTLIAAALVLAIGGTILFVMWRRRLREWPWDASSPTAGVLARENTTRNPARTAVTAAALMIGIGLVVFFSPC